LGEKRTPSYGIIFTSISFTKGGESYFKGSNDSVFGDSCQRGREYEPKAKGPHHHHIFKKMMIFNWEIQIGIFLCSKGGETSISKLIYQNPLEH
jgi:hypothetical protein